MAKAWEIEGLAPEQRLTESARRIIVTKFREAFFYRAAVTLGNDREAVHDMRVSLRRLWAAVQSFSNCFDQDPEFGRLARKTRKLARRLGAVRDLDVLIEILQERARKSALSDNEAVALNDLIALCLKRRDKRYRKLLQYFLKLDRQQFEAEFLHFFAVDQDSHLSIATTPGY